MNPKLVFLTLSGTLLVIVVLAVFFSSKPSATPNLDDFAKCLNQKGFTMYGSASCSHCLKEKSNFGSSFQYIKYVECPDNPVLCTSKNIAGFPTWEDSVNNKLYEGEQGLTKLSEYSGCSLPK